MTEPAAVDQSATGTARIAIALFLIEHDLFGKPVPTFPDHALEAKSPASLPGFRIFVLSGGLP
jgi:hypothetical protein